MLALPNATLRHAAAGLVVQLLPGQGREVLEAAQEQLQVCFLWDSLAWRMFP